MTGRAAGAILPCWTVAFVASIACCLGCGAAERCFSCGAPDGPVSADVHVDQAPVPDGNNPSDASDSSGGFDSFDSGATDIIADAGAGDVPGDVPAADAAADVAGDAAGTDAGVDAGTDAAPADAGPRDLGTEAPVVVVPFAHYSFDDPSGTVAVDSSGNARHGTLIGGATLGLAGQIASDVSLNGVAGSYVDLPDALLDTVRDVTIATWIKLRTARDWQRVFDFGSSNTKYMFLTTRATGAAPFLRFAITTMGNGMEQQLTGTAALPVGSWQHVAIVLGAAGGTLYINGAVVATNAAMALRPADLAPTANIWLGRSQFTADQYLDGELDDFLIYDRALTATEITAVFMKR